MTERSVDEFVKKGKERFWRLFVHVLLTLPKLEFCLMGALAQREIWAC
jgi:hypothetical protein